MNRGLLIVDDEQNVLNSLQRELRRQSYAIYSADSAATGLDILREHRTGVVLSDQMMPEIDGVTFLEAVKQHRPDVVRMLLTAHASIDNAMAAINRLIRPSGAWLALANL